MAEKGAKDAGHDVVVGMVPMGAVAATIVYSDRGGMVNSVHDKIRGPPRRQHRRGEGRRPDPGTRERRELEGDYHEVARTIHAHPSFAEAVMEAARATDGWLIHG